MTKWSWSDDPNRDKEAQKYENPIASREFISSIIEKQGAPMKVKDITHALRIEKGSDAHIALKRRLKAMVRDGQLLRSSSGHYSK